MSAHLQEQPVTVRNARLGMIAHPDAAWLAKQAKEPIIEPDLPIIDCHHHLWDRRGHRYFAEELLEDISTGHNVVATITSECEMMYRTTGPEELKPVGETEFIAQMAETGSTDKVKVAAGIVGYANMTLGEKVEPVLQAHIEAGKGRFCGVRFPTHWDPSKDIPSRGAPGLMEKPEFRAGLSRMAANNLVFDAWVFHPQLPDLIKLAQAMPDLSIVCCHAGGQLGYGPYTGKAAEIFKAWKSSMTELARCPNVSVKLGGLVMRLAAFDYTTAPTPPTSEQLAQIWGPTLSTCIELFGAERCMFESNFPVDKMATGYAVLWNAFKRVASAASADEKKALFSGTARKIYHLN